MLLSFDQLKACIVGCTKCPRLVAFRQEAPKRAIFKDQTYWRKPVAGFGDLNAWLLILGLAPSAQGANRTGRIFTGDPSAAFLFEALFAAGFSNQPFSEGVEDGLELKGCYLTPIVKCVPPKNLPLKGEFENCTPYFENEFFLLKRIKAVLALGGMAFEHYQKFLQKEAFLKNRTPFKHGKKVTLNSWPPLYGSFHPSPQNTYTKKLTKEMFMTLLEKIIEENAP